MIYWLAVITLMRLKDFANARKDEQQLRAEGKEYLLEQGLMVGTLLIDCSQNNRSWASLSEESKD